MCRKDPHATSRHEGDGGGGGGGRMCDELGNGTGLVLVSIRLRRWDVFRSIMCSTTCSITCSITDSSACVFRGSDTRSGEGATKSFDDWIGKWGTPSKSKSYQKNNQNLPLRRSQIRYVR